SRRAAALPTPGLDQAAPAPGPLRLRDQLPVIEYTMLSLRWIFRLIGLILSISRFPIAIILSLPLLVYSIRYVLLISIPTVCTIPFSSHLAICQPDTGADKKLDSF